MGIRVLLQCAKGYMSEFSNRWKKNMRGALCCSGQLSPENAKKVPENYKIGLENHEKPLEIIQDPLKFVMDFNA